MINTSLGAWLFGALLCALALFPSSAVAAIDLGFNPPPGDKSIGLFLKPLFGSLFGGESGGAFEKALGVLNAGALAVGGVLAAYTIIFGTMSTAHDGEMLGRKWSSAWVPIRTALGVALVAPLSGGFCVAQLLVAWCIGQGVGLADAVWSKYMTEYLETRSMAPIATLPNVESLAQSILQSQLCMASYNQVLKVSQLSPGSAPMSASATAAGGRQYGGGGLAKDTCGSISYTLLSRAEAAYSTRNGFTGALTADAVAIFGPSFGNQSLKVIEQSHSAATLKMEGTLSTLATQMVLFRDGGPAPEMSLLGQSIVQYQADVAEAAKSVFGGEDMLKQVREAATQDGWYMAGSWFTKAAQMQDAVNRVVAAVPSAHGMRPSELATFADSMAPYIASAAGLLKTADSGIDNSNMSAILSAGNTNNPFQQAFSSLTEGIASGVISVIQTDSNRHPLMSLKDMGDHLMVGAEMGVLSGIAIVSAGAGVKSTSDSLIGQGINILSFGASSALAGAGSAGAGMVGALIVSFSLLLFAFATTIAVYLPMAPQLIYFGVFIGWVILCLEAIIAAPLVAIMKLAPGGDDVMGSSRPAYMLILGLLLRPVLIVLGFICASIFISLAISGFNAIFFPVFLRSMAGSIIGIGSLIGMVAIYTGFVIYTFHQIFGLIHVIPDKLLRWIGGGGEQLGEAGIGAAREGKAAAVGAVVAITERGANTTAQGMGHLGSQRAQRQGNDQAAQREFSKSASELSESRAKAVNADEAARSPNAGAGAKFSAMNAKAKVATDARQASMMAMQLGDHDKSSKLGAEGDAAEQRATELMSELGDMADTASEHADGGKFKGKAARADAHKKAAALHKWAHEARNVMVANNMSLPADNSHVIAAQRHDKAAEDAPPKKA